MLYNTDITINNNNLVLIMKLDTSLLNTHINDMVIQIESYHNLLFKINDIYQKIKNNSSDEVRGKILNHMIKVNKMIQEMQSDIDLLVC